MTVSTTSSRISYSGNDVTTAFAFPYKFIEDADLVVVLTDSAGTDTELTLSTHYTVSGEGTDSSGAVTMVTPPASGETLTIYRSILITQETDYISGDAFPAETHENALDKLTLISQDLQTQVYRTIKIGETISGVDTTLPKPEAGKHIAWNSTSTGLVNDDSPAQTVGAAYIDEIQVATDGQTVFTLTGFTYTPGARNLSVYINGVRQYAGQSYTETNTTTVTFSSGLNAGDEVLFVTADTVTNTVSSAASVQYQPAGTGAVATNVQDRLRLYESENGSSEIGFLQAGTGAVATNVQDALRNTKSDIYSLTGMETSGVLAYQVAAADTAILEVVPEGGAYNSFPRIAKIKGGRLVGLYWHGNGHSPTIAGDNLGDLKVTYSDDGGATWSTPVAILGNISGGSSNFAYYKAFGTDSKGRAVLVATVYNGSYNESGIMFSEDGVSWTDWTAVTFSGEGTIPTAPLPFGQIKIDADGQVLVPFYSSGNGRWVGHIDLDVSETAITFDQICDETVENGGNEFALCVVSQLEKYAFLRNSGSTNEVVIYRTTDGGTTWAAFDTMNIGVKGGWLPQDAFLASVHGKLFVCVLLGVRKTVSAPPDNSPAVSLFMSPLQQARDDGELVFSRVHDWALADDGEARDAYVGGVYDKHSNTVIMLANEETATDESRIVAGAVRIDELFQSPVNPTSVTFTPLLNSVTYTDDGSTATFTKIGNQVFGRIQLEWTSLDTGDVSGFTIRTSDFPYAIASSGPCQVDLVSGSGAGLNGFNFSASDAVHTSFASANATISLHNADGIGYAYNSGKIQAAGGAVFYVQYTTTDWGNF